MSSIPLHPHCDYIHIVGGFIMFYTPIVVGSVPHCDPLPYLCAISLGFHMFSPHSILPL